jgi:hypothetical protein
MYDERRISLGKVPGQLYFKPQNQKRSQWQTVTESSGQGSSNRCWTQNTLFIEDLSIYCIDYLYNLSLLHEPSSPPTFWTIPEGQGHICANSGRTGHAPSEYISASERWRHGSSATAFAGQCSIHFTECRTCSWKVGQLQWRSCLECRQQLDPSTASYVPKWAKCNFFFWYRGSIKKQHHLC